MGARPCRGRRRGRCGDRGRLCPRAALAWPSPRVGGAFSEALALALLAPAAPPAAPPTPGMVMVSPMRGRLGLELGLASRMARVLSVVAPRDGGECVPLRYTWVVSASATVGAASAVTPASGASAHASACASKREGRETTRD